MSRLLLVNEVNRMKTLSKHLRLCFRSISCRWANFVHLYFHEYVKFVRLNFSINSLVSNSNQNIFQEQKTNWTRTCCKSFDLADVSINLVKTIFKTRLTTWRGYFKIQSTRFNSTFSLISKQQQKKQNWIELNEFVVSMKTFECCFN